MNQQMGNEFSDAIAILNRYYRAMVVQLAEDVVSNEGEFATPFLGNAESILEKYARPLVDLGQLHQILSVVGESIFQEKIAHLREDEFLCFGCRSIVRKEHLACPKCGWSWTA
jgi:hypothetical protein